jgi:3-oxoacyl-[acyl-carrier protein] reductase
MDLGLKGKSALVLAGSKGLGKACAMALAREGANVVIGARGVLQNEASAREIREATGSRVLAVPVDVTDPLQIEAIFAAAASEFGRVDILVNNAGGPPFAPFEQLTDRQWHDALELNLMSTVRCTRLAIPGMKAAGWGRIVNIVSLGVKSVLPGSVLSTAGRLGIVGMSKLLSDELASFCITVNCVASGMILTDRMRETALKTTTIEALSEKIPAGRLGRPEELGALVAFLASEQASYITGTTIPVDGGIVRSIL